MVEVALPYVDYAYRITFFGDEIEEIESFEPSTGRTSGKLNNVAIFPANLYVTAKDKLLLILDEIRLELDTQIQYFKEVGKHIEAARLKERVEFDMEMMRELGYCSGIENYSRFLTGSSQGNTALLPARLFSQ